MLPRALRCCRGGGCWRGLLPHRAFSTNGVRILGCVLKVLWVLFVSAVVGVFLWLGYFGGILFPAVLSKFPAAVVLCSFLVCGSSCAVRLEAGL
ncbi:transmembrane protein, putative [Medicago truncatula]|uniref:Transmembrane protein, putative n=1 Tax=Medicago truncatula TaxID=3880 RepID=A0A072TRD7_MEDTR|nr:transmembrane protein, putative [Medicago truncatula]